MPDLLIRIKKQKDGSAALSCVRADGSVTWQRQLGQLGAVFPLHDLTHYIVETTLGYAHAFFGLVADGWDLSDFAAPWPRGKPPREAREVETIVGALDMDRYGGREQSLEEYNEQTRFASDRDSRDRFVPRQLTESELAQLRQARRELFARWSALEPGDTLELPFNRTAVVG